MPAPRERSPPAIVRLVVLWVDATQRETARRGRERCSRGRFQLRLLGPPFRMLNVKSNNGPVEAGSKGHPRGLGLVPSLHLSHTFGGESLQDANCRCCNCDRPHQERYSE